MLFLHQVRRPPGFLPSVIVVYCVDCISSAESHLPSWVSSPASGHAAGFWSASISLRFLHLDSKGRLFWSFPSHDIIEFWDFFLYFVKTSYYYYPICICIYIYTHMHKTFANILLIFYSTLWLEVFSFCSFVFVELGMECRGALSLSYITPPAIYLFIYLF